MTRGGWRERGVRRLTRCDFRRRVMRWEGLRVRESGCPASRRAGKPGWCECGVVWCFGVVAGADGSQRGGLLDARCWMLERRRGVTGEATRRAGVRGGTEGFGGRAWRGEGEERRGSWYVRKRGRGRALACRWGERGRERESERAKESESESERAGAREKERTSCLRPPTAKLSHPSAKTTPSRAASSCPRPCLTRASGA